MPKLSAAPKNHACPFCDKKYSVPNSVYAHVRTHHPGQTYKAKNFKVKPTITTKDPLEEQIMDLKHKFLNDEIDAFQYTDMKNQILGCSIKTIQTKPRPTYDFDKLANGDVKYAREIVDKSGLDINDLTTIANKNEYVNLLTQLFSTNDLQMEHDKLFKVYRTFVNMLCNVKLEEVKQLTSGSESLIDVQDKLLELTGLVSSLNETVDIKNKPYVMAELFKIIE